MKVILSLILVTFFLTMNAQVDTKSSKDIFTNDHPVEVATVEKNKIRYINYFKKGIGVGGGSGIAIGTLLGFASGDDPPGFLSFSAGEKAFILGTFLGFTGGVIGLTFNTIKYFIDKSRIKSNNNQHKVSYINPLKLTITVSGIGLVYSF